MSRRLLAAFSLFAVTTASTSARADTEDLTNASVVVGLERVVSLITWEQFTASSNGQSTSETLTSIATFSTDPGGVGDAFALSPRLGVDAVVSHGLTLGGSAWVFTDISRSASSGGTSQDQPKRTWGGIAPRVGYILPLTPSLAFWPRAGVAYSTLSTSTANTGAGAIVSSGGTSLSQFSVDLEGNLVYSPFPRVDDPIPPGWRESSP